MRLPRLLRRVGGYTYFTRRDRLFYRFTTKWWEPFGFYFGDLREKEGQNVRFAWAVGSRRIYIGARPLPGVFVRLGRHPRVTVTRHAFPRFLRRPLCAYRGHKTNRWIAGYDAFECLCGANQITGPQMVRLLHEEDH